MIGFIYFMVLNINIPDKIGKGKAAIRHQLTPLHSNKGYYVNVTPLSTSPRLVVFV